jgi:hypothetical protein
MHCRAVMRSSQIRDASRGAKCHSHSQPSDVIRSAKLPSASALRAAACCGNYPSLVSADVQDVTDERATLKMGTRSAWRASVTARLVFQHRIGPLRDR